MKVTRQARLYLSVPVEGGYFGQARPLLATELLDAVNRLVATLPSDARIEPSLQPDPRWGPHAQPDPRWGMGGAALVFSWEENLPSAAETEH